MNATFEWRKEQDLNVLYLEGSWTIENTIPEMDDVLKSAQLPTERTLPVNCSKLEGWDSMLVSFLLKLDTCLSEKDIELEKAGLPSGVRGLLHLATAVEERSGAARAEEKQSYVTRTGERTLAMLDQGAKTISFMGDALICFGRLLVGKANFRKSDLATITQECGPEALPIITVISVLVGMILAFLGAVQLQMFGAQIFVADLVGIGMVREMGALMTGIIMAGRTGAAFAAQLGTMQVNEEIDALKTLGFNPMEFLVLPRMIALILMMPLLTMFANFLGILGGAIVGVGMLDLTVPQYINQTINAITLNALASGLIKSAVFGVLVALAGCMRGMQSGRSASAVGEAATNAVVSGILYIIVSDSLLTIIFMKIGL